MCKYLKMLFVMVFTLCFFAVTIPLTSTALPGVNGLGKARWELEPENMAGANFFIAAAEKDLSLATAEASPDKGLKSSPRGDVGGLKTVWPYSKPGSNSRGLYESWPLKDQSATTQCELGTPGILPRSQMLSSCYPQKTSLNEGDIIFQRAITSQCAATKLAISGELLHCGIVLFQDGKPVVLDASSEVTVVPLDDWIDKGVDGKFSVLRLKDSSVLTPLSLAGMHKISARLDGVRYDESFPWDENKVYCSEVVWKIYKLTAGVELCPLRQLKDYYYNNPDAMRVMHEYFGDKVPLDEWVVSPTELMYSPLLEFVRME